MSDYPEQDEMDIRTGLTVLQQNVHKTAVEHGWWDIGGEGQTFGEKVCLMHSELSEALESYRNGEAHLWYKHTQGLGNADEPTDVNGDLGKPEGVAAELADAVIRIMDYCQYAGIPLAEAIIRKTAYNQTRPYKHGGKRI